MEKLEFKTTNDILDFAINSEQEAVDFYTALAADARSTDMKKVFEDFANEERGHKKRLQSIKETGQMNFTEKQVRDLKMTDYLVDIKPYPGMNYQEALVVAMKKEKAAFKLYNDLAEMTDDALMKSIFHSLAIEESKHKLRFELEYDEHVLKDN